MKVVETAVIFLKSIKNKKFILKKSFLYSSLGLTESGREDYYSYICFACDSVKSCISVISDYTFDIDHVTSKEDCINHADYAMKSGAKLLISTFQIKDYPCLIVENPIEAYCRVISAIKQRYNVKTISVTGSIGKTTTSDMISYVIYRKYNVLHSWNNTNDIRYSGLNVQDLNKTHEYYVQEIMEAPPFGTASAISKMVHPDISVITVVGTSHLEQLKTQERILESCLGIQDGMPETGSLVMNGDDPFQINAKTRFKPVYYGISNEKADYRGLNIRYSGNMLCFDVLHDGVTTPVEICCIGRHNVLDALAAFAVGKLSGLTDDEIVKGLKTFKTSGIRQNLVSIGTISVFLDCFNSSIESMESSLEAFNAIAKDNEKNRIAVIGDIFEAGEQEDDIHQELGRMVSEADFQTIIFFGEKTSISAEATREYSGKRVYHTTDRGELVSLIRTSTRPGDLILVKGGHGNKLELAIDRAFGTRYYEINTDRECEISLKDDVGNKYDSYGEYAVFVKPRRGNGKVSIPDSVNGFPVAAIGSGAFSKSTVTEVLLPDSLESIRSSSFSQAKQLKTVVLPKNVVMIGDNAFESCTRLTEFVINPGCLHIGNHAFADCTDLEKIVIPPSVYYIGDDAFPNSGKLTICGKKGSFAQEYADKNNLPFDSE